jgi:histidine ammonia-lyase
MDSLGVAMAEIGSMAERRLDRLLNPLLSGLPAFLAREGGVASGFMIAQYTTVALVVENRRLAAPASLDAGVTSALQEDHLSHATAAALQSLDIVANVRTILAIELLAACQACELQPDGARPGPRTAVLLAAVRARVAPYADDRPLGDDIRVVAEWMAEQDCPV